MSWPELPERKPCPISSKLFTRDCHIKTLLPHIRKLRTSQLPSSVARTTRRNTTPRLPSAGPEALCPPFSVLVAPEVSSPGPQSLPFSPQSFLLSPQHSVLSPFPSVLSPFPSVLSPFPSVLSPFPSVLWNLIHTVAVNRNGFMQLGMCYRCFKTVFISTYDIDFDKWCFMC